MFKYAHIINGAVVNLCNYETEVIHESLVSILDSVDVEVGNIYDNGVFSKPVIEEEIPTNIMPIVIGTVTNTLPDFDENDNQYTVTENTNCLAIGTLAIPNQKFRVPFRRLDTGRIQLMVAEVLDGKFTLSMTFKTGGIWVVNNELINAELAEPMFSIAEHRFAVI